MTCLKNGELRTERLVQIGSKMSTQSKLDEENLMRGDSAVLESGEKAGASGSGGVLDEEPKIEQCQNHKAEGNEAF